MGFEIRLDEVSTCGRSYNLRGATWEELRDAANMVVVAMCADYIILPGAFRIEGTIVVFWYRVVLNVVPKSSETVCS
jgi:hypothetical protein